MEPENILDVAREIRSSMLPPKKKMEHFKDVHKDFAEKYPTLFNLCCEGTAELGHLESMCHFLATHSKEDASAKVGQMLFDDYVKPVLPPEQKKRKRPEA